MPNELWLYVASRAGCIVANFVQVGWDHFQRLLSMVDEHFGPCRRHLLPVRQISSGFHPCTSSEPANSSWGLNEGTFSF